MAGLLAAALPAAAQDEMTIEEMTAQGLAEDGMGLTANPPQDEIPGVPGEEARFVSAEGARLRVLDKVAGRTQDLEIRRNETQPAFRLAVTLGDCRYPADDPSSEAFAELHIEDRGTVVFDAWMLASSPALSALDHPRYDVWVLDCLGTGQDG